MSASELGALLEKLSKFPADAPLSDVLLSLRQPEPAGVTEAEKRCALVRSFDRDVYDFVCGGIAGKPDFEKFVASAELQRLAPARWAIEDDTRLRLLSAWQSDQRSWREWNKKLGDYFSARQGPEAQLDAVYHLAASSQPEQMVPKFITWYSEADQRFEMAQCNALLEMLRVQQDWRGVSISRLSNARARARERQVFRARAESPNAAGGTSGLTDPLLKSKNYSRKLCG
jgi:hypothetical protein